MSPIKVGVNGYGVIGKRVADAVNIQPDIRLVGVADVVADYRIKLAEERGYAVYGSTPGAVQALGDAGLRAAGVLEDLLRAVDVVVDATPKKVGQPTKPVYETAEVKVIFQGGEKHELAGTSLVAQAN